MQTNQDTSNATADEVYVDAVAAGDTCKVSTKRTHYPEFKVADILVVPEENYRWGNHETMEMDLAKVEFAGDGVQVNSFEKLCENIKTMGVQTAVGLVRRDDGRFHVIFGFTRCVASQRLGLATIPAYVYESTISDSEVELLQLMENAEELHRQVNWVQELEMIDGLVARFAARLTGGGDNKPTKRAVEQVAKLTGKSAGTIRNRLSWRGAMDERVIKLGKAGRIGHVAALLLTGEGSSVKTNKLPKAFLDKVLARLKVGNDYPTEITAQSVRDAIRAVRITDSAQLAADGEKPERDVTPPKTRQSPAMLRDISVMLARLVLRKGELTIASEASKVQKVVGMDRWFEIRGYGVGAGDALVPPVLEMVLGRRSAEKDEHVQRLQAQYERSGDTYATRCFVEALIHDAMEKAGVYCVGDADHSGWKTNKTVMGSKTIDNGSVYRNAMAAAMAMRDNTKLLDRAKAAWEILKPVVLASAKPRR